MANDKKISPENLESLLRDCGAELRERSISLTKDIRSQSISSAVAAAAEQSFAPTLRERLKEIFGSVRPLMIPVQIAAACVLLLSFALLTHIRHGQQIPEMSLDVGSGVEVDDELAAAFSGVNSELFAFNDIDTDDSSPNDADSDDSESDDDDSIQDSIEPGYQTISISSSDFQQSEDNDHGAYEDDDV